jgi:hypothetical protein
VQDLGLDQQTVIVELQQVRLWLAGGTCARVGVPQSATVHDVTLLTLLQPCGMSDAKQCCMHRHVPHTLVP